MTSSPLLLSFERVAKSFTLHLQGGVIIPAVANVSFEVTQGECIVLGGPSGAGKSSLLKMAYGTYRCETGRVLVRDAGGNLVDVATAEPHAVLALRATTMSYVSQFLRVIPRVGTLDIVAEAGVAGGMADSDARSRARDLLTRLNIAERLWPLPPATFSGGEQQRVNIARGLCALRPLLLLDEPTASLDHANREVVIDLVRERKAAGAAILGIFHDEEVRDRVADRIVDIRQFAAA